MKLIHISDIHYELDRSEEVGLLVDELFKDLIRILEKCRSDRVVLILSGDIAMSGDNSEPYEVFTRQLREVIDSQSFSSVSVVCVPGNHDISRGWLSEHRINHSGVVSQDFDESAFNEYVISGSSILPDKLKRYFEFESHCSDYGVGSATPWGSGHNFDDIVGFYCLNSAIFCSGVSSSDQGSLRANTRAIRDWCKSSKSKMRILVMHHPFSWFDENTKAELSLIAHKEFDLVLNGHEHDQVAWKSDRQGQSVIICSAPALHHKKNENLGYAIVSVSTSGEVEGVNYRSWTKHQNFVTGSIFSNTDDGKVRFADTGPREEGSTEDSSDSFGCYAIKFFQGLLEDKLQCISDQPDVWIDPPLFDNDAATGGKKISLGELVTSEYSVIVNAPESFGSSCLSLKTTIELWRLDRAAVHICCDGLKPYRFRKVLEQECLRVDIQSSAIEVIILDSCNPSSRDHAKIIEQARDLYPQALLFVFYRATSYLSVAKEFSCPVTGAPPRRVSIGHLDRSHIRALVEQYNAMNYVGDSELVTERLIADLLTFNLHRTPLNCLLLLRASEANFDESPVNRTEVIKRVLFLLFSTEDVPTYKGGAPDLTDCEFLLGEFAEYVMRSNTLEFSRLDVIDRLSSYCKAAIIKLDVHQLFDLLVSANVFVENGSGCFSFKFSYWLMYFGARRMHHSNDFRDFIFDENRYASHPEMMEFYTGIDRKRDDAVRRIIDDLSDLNEKIRVKLGEASPSEFYDLGRWKPDESVVEQMQEKLENGVQESNLPQHVKDSFADRGYDPTAPHNQTVRLIAKELLLDVLMSSIRAGSRALRNSDYASPELKKELMGLILQCWETVTSIILVISPSLANEGYAIYEGTRFTLTKDFDKYDGLHKFGAVLQAGPENVISWFIDDIYSEKMSRIFEVFLRSETSNISKHYLILSLILKRPSGWHGFVEKYIAEVDGNSFYLSDIDKHLGVVLAYGSLCFDDREMVSKLRKNTWSKHAPKVRNNSKKRRIRR